MTCPLFDDLSAYADNVLASGERARLADHILACRHCRVRLEELAALRGGLRALPSPALGFDLAARLAEMRVLAPSKRPARRFWPVWPQASLTLAALVSGIWFGGLLTGGAAVGAPSAPLMRAFDPVPPGGLCAAPELCRMSKGIQ